MWYPLPVVVQVEYGVVLAVLSATAVTEHDFAAAMI